MKKLAPWLVLSAGILWGMIGLFVRKLNELGFDSMEIVALRSVTTSMLLFVFLLLYDKRLLKIAIKDLWCFIGTGIFSIVFFNYCYFKAITLTSLSTAAILLYTAPAILMVLSFFLFQEKITGRKITALVLTFAGCIFVTGLVGEEASLGMKGFVFGLGAGLGYALYSVFSRFALKRGYHPLTISFYTFTFAIFGTLPLLKIGNLVSKGISTPRMIPYYLMFGLISTVIPYITYTLGLSKMENTTASIIASIEPVAATIIGMLVYREKLSFMGGLGAVLVFAAIIICNLPAKEKS